MNKLKIYLSGKGILTEENIWSTSIALSVAQCVTAMIVVMTMRDYPQAVWYDSVGYIFAHEVRSPLYVLFLQAYKAVVGYDNFWPLVIIQSGLLFFSACFLAKTFYDYMDVSKSISAVILFVLTLPSSIMILAFGQPFLVGPFILSEALSYPLFLIAMAFLMRGVCRKNTRDICLFLLMVALLALTRRQFLALYPFCIGMSVFFLLFMRKDFKPFIILICTFLSLFSAEFLERSYRYVAFGYFEPPPFLGGQLLVPALFVADESDVDLFDDPLQRLMFQEMIARVAHYSISKRYVSSRFYEPPLIENHPYEDQPLFRVDDWWEEDRQGGLIEFKQIMPKMLRYDYFYDRSGALRQDTLYEYAYNIIFHHIITPIFWGNGVDDWQRFEKVTKEMAVPIIEENIEEYLLLYVHILSSALGGYAGVLFLMLLIAGLGWCAIRIKHPLIITSFFVLIIHFGNIAGISILEYPLMRYTFYSYFVLLALLVAGGDAIWKYDRKIAAKCVE